MEKMEVESSAPPRKRSSENISNSNAKSEESFQNVGLQNWLKLREEWKGKKPITPPKTRKVRQYDPEVLYEELYSPERRDGLLSQPVPLPDIISVMNEVWEADGLQ